MANKNIYSTAAQLLCVCAGCEFLVFSYSFQLKQNNSLAIEVFILIAVHFIQMCCYLSRCLMSHRNIPSWCRINQKLEIGCMFPSFCLFVCSTNRSEFVYLLWRENIIKSLIRKNETTISESMNGINFWIEQKYLLCFIVLMESNRMRTKKLSVLSIATY